jgi:very-short-patch-repair endonuclease
LGGGNTLASRWARLYAHPTAEEEALELHVAALGVPYRFQHPVFPAHAILDYAVFPPGGAKWALEIDGKSHFTSAGRLKDLERTAKLEALGWRVWRCTNDEVANNPARVAARFWETVTTP